MVQTILDTLLQFPLFQSYNRESITWLNEAHRYVRLKSGDIVFRQNAPPRHCYILVDGLLQVCKQTTEAEIPLDEIHPGAFCGEISLMTDTPTTALVRAAEESVLIQLDQQDLYHLLENNPTAERMMMRIMAERVRNAETVLWHEERDALLKIEYDVHTARNIQLDFLPARLPQLPGWHIVSRFSPAREVAGDFYDSFLMVQNRRLGVLIADVCDKGVGSALFMALSRSLLRAYAQQNQSLSSSMFQRLSDTQTEQTPRKRGFDRAPNELSVGSATLQNALVSTNAYIVENHARMNMFVTVFFGMLDPATGTLIYINAGHEAPYLIGADGVKERLKPTGPAVGLFPGAAFQLGEVHLEPGDILFTYTDGVTDAHNPAGERLGKAQLHELLNQPAPSATVLLERVEECVRQHRADAEQFDDITMVTVQRDQTEP